MKPELWKSDGRAEFSVPKTMGEKRHEPLLNVVCEVAKDMRPAERAHLMKTVKHARGRVEFSGKSEQQPGNR